MVSLKHAYEQGSLRIAFYCVRPPGGCNRSGSIGIEEALRRWGGDMQVKDVPARCSGCRTSAHVATMAIPPGRPGKRGRR